MHACKFSRIPQPITSTLILASKSTQDRPYPVKINIGKAAQPFLVQAEPPVLASSVRPALNHGLIRSSTLPAEAFVERERKSVPAAPSTEPMISSWDPLRLPISSYRITRRVRRRIRGRVQDPAYSSSYPWSKPSDDYMPLAEFLHEGLHAATAMPWSLTVEGCRAHSAAQPLAPTKRGPLNMALAFGVLPFVAYHKSL
ncbi:hypothetical protein C8J57DRAFT_1609093 [Mycena rebaudengoi]|nr:hypothetical protein C8J57DRAFT_1609093 [Mycena rebaudengoi]